MFFSARHETSTTQVLHAADIPFPFDHFFFCFLPPAAAAAAGAYFFQSKSVKPHFQQADFGEKFF